VGYEGFMLLLILLLNFQIVRDIGSLVTGIDGPICPEYLTYILF